MGLITQVMGLLFGPGGNMVRETAEVFRVNAEASDMRAAEVQQAVLKQFAAEFAQMRPGLFDRLIDALNRLPRPMLALGTLGLFVSAMFDPIWFAARMQGIALVPEPLWWLLGAIISFYFGARHQAKGQEFQRSVMETMARVPVMTGNLRTLRQFDWQAENDLPAPQTGPNPALEDWRAGA
ncbi:holin family protein [Actibacterium sp. XHP0104]|uniref:holin family protein n=1 Tax=Actibacterium sp. XHP0104 TaxID=2984335 RepID=UPI0021E8D24B|nr:holin family protein [Actibacterium sp. XHP0104]MCV2880858.1 holin family protein [Actibacterium sp. XHP0104]